jgi:hypothetical protein
MANIQIPNLPPVIALNGTELLEGVQAGSSVRIAVGQIVAAAAIGTPPSFPFPILIGGTGATTAPDARTNLGLGNIAVQNASSVALTGGSINGTTIGGTTAAAGSFSTGTFGLGSVGTPSITFTGDTNTGIWSPAANTFAISTDGVERFRIASSGQIGIAGANYGTTGQTVLSGGPSAAPAWGTLGLAGGGTGVTTAPAAAAVLYGYTATATAAGTTVLTNTSSQYQLFTGVTTQTITLPVTSTLTTGWTFHIVNNSTGNLTVNSSGANLVATIPANMTLMVTCIGTTLTTAADWEWGFTDFGSVTGTGSVVLGTGPTITGGALNGTVGATTPSTGAFTTVIASTSVLSNGAGGIGYSTGAGVAVTQLTSRTTPAPTTGNKTSGAITLFTAAPVLNAWVSFTVPNTAIAITDTVSITVRGATNTYIASVTAIVAATSFTVTIASVLGTASDTPIINFNIIRGVSA